MTTCELGLLLFFAVVVLLVLMGTLGGFIDWRL